MVCGIQIAEAVDTEIDYEITDEQYERLYEKRDDVFHLDEDDDLCDIYDEVSEALLKREIAMIRKEPEIIEYYILDDDAIDELYASGYEKYVSSLSDDEIRIIINEAVYRFIVNMPKFDE